MHETPQLISSIFTFGSGTRVTSSGSWGGSSRSSGSTSYIGDEVFDVDSSESLGKETGPDGLYVHIGSLQDGGDLLRLKNKYT